MHWEYWEYYEIVDFTNIYVDRDEVEHGYTIRHANGETKDEYYGKKKNIIAVLNCLGEQGWEVIAVRERLDEYKDEETGKLEFSSHKVIYTLKSKIKIT